MISTLTPHSAEQKLASCSSRQEVWKKDHELAMALYKFESCLNKAKLSAMHDFDMEAEIDYRTKLPSLDYCTELRTPIEEWPE